METSTSSSTTKVPTTSTPVVTTKRHTNRRRISFGAKMIGAVFLVLLSLKTASLSPSLPITTTTTTTSKKNCSTPPRTMTVRTQHNATHVTIEHVPFVYTPSTFEAHVMEHADALHLNSPTGKDSGCKWMKSTLVPIPIEGSNETMPDPSLLVHQYLQELAAAQKLQKALTLHIPDLRKQIAIDGDHRVCDTLQLHPQGLAGLFSDTKARPLSHANTYGYLEPLLPPMRHLSICSEWARYLMDTDFILHDFPALCRQLQPTSKIIFVDLGAALDFHGRTPSPVIAQIEQFAAMGFAFDDIYGFEMQPKDTNAVFRKQLPEAWIHKYHWINLGISADPQDRLHPFRLLQSFVNPDDFVIVKLDIDTPHIEVPLAQQLLPSNDNDDYASLVDVLFFEHHVRLKELEPWGPGVEGSVKESMQLFHGLRQQGIAAHSWV